ncbi:flagellar hook capping FlgD N-terminal domain-containing protein [Caldimonas brevitalea]|uniref:Basal-body rod modification protein FlgD n=1 Tax=Caldimonas brevitalea TaxID=413882 RepID=A0A0G3BSJ5_9BURK|nr:flagellar hook capping FlgD N-terminal domain-containing protein [Caldimonas brevitalea]AKJ30351.1 flagellar basal-body rod modification protein FlgD [Caldimonas brevitalea]
MQTQLLTTGAQGAAETPDAAAAAIAGNGAPSQLFTTLLVAQIKNQNPLEPADPSEFVGQLTQLSQMEALQKLASQSAGNASLLENLQQLALGAQVGSQVSVRTDSVSIGEQPLVGRFTLESGTSQASVVLSSATGQQHRIDLGPQAAGDVGFEIDPARYGIAPGRYAIRIDSDARQAPEVEVSGELLNVKFSSTGGTLLQLDTIGEVAATSITGLQGRRTTSR